MNSADYIRDCVKKVGDGEQLNLTREQTMVLQGLAAGYIDTGRALSLLKKDIFQYGKMRINKDLTVPEVIVPLELDESMHVALRGILGMSGELADVMETVYLWFQGGELDVDKIKTDLGDLTFYASLLLKVLNTDWETIQNDNRIKTDHILRQPSHSESLDHKD